MTKHTPKPWVMVGPRGKGFNRNYGICHESPGHVGGEFATVHTLHQTPEAHATQDANACLIIEAPELLAALEELLDFVYSRIDPYEYDYPRYVRLIAKAKGEI